MHKIKNYFLAIGLFATTQMTMAEGVYVVGSLGAGIPAKSIQSDIDSVLIAAGFANFTSSMKNGTLMSGALGYAINDFFAVEAGYMNSGTMTYSATVVGGVISSDIKVTATQIAFVGTAPINEQFSIYGKVGYSWATTEAAVKVTAGSVTVSSPTFSQDKNSAGYGIGAAYKISDKISMRAGYDLFAKDLSGVTASLVFKF